MTKQIHETPSAPEPVGPYSVATEANGFVFVSGQVAIDPATNAPVAGGVETQARQVLENVRSVLADVGLVMSDVVKTSIFLADIADFGKVNAVYAEFFDDARPARSTIQAGALPGGYLVEIDLIAAR